MLTEQEPMMLADTAGENFHQLIPFFIVIGALSTSWPGLTRPSTSLVRLMIQDVDARDKRGHDESSIVSIGITQASLDTVHFGHEYSGRAVFPEEGRQMGRWK